MLFYRIHNTRSVFNNKTTLSCIIYYVYTWVYINNVQIQTLHIYMFMYIVIIFIEIQNHSICLNNLLHKHLDPGKGV